MNTKQNYIADLLAKEAEKTYDAINSLRSMLYDIEAMLPHNERLYPLNSPHKKHYPKLHSLLQNRPPQLQVTPTASVSLLNHNSRIRTTTTLSSNIKSIDRKNSATSTTIVPVSSHSTTKSDSEPESTTNKAQVLSEIELKAHSVPTTPKLKHITSNDSAQITTDMSTNNSDDDKTNPTSLTGKMNLDYPQQKKIPIKLSASVLSGDSDIAFLFTDDETNDEESIGDQEEDESDSVLGNYDDDNLFSYEHAGVDLDFTSPVHLSSAVLPTTSVSTATISPTYPPAMLKLQSVLPQSLETIEHRHRRTHSFDSLDSAGSNTSLKSTSKDILDVSKNNRRKSAPYMLRQASDILLNLSGQTSPSSTSIKPKSFTLTSFFANAWAGAASKLGMEDGELPIGQSLSRQNAVSSGIRAEDDAIDSYEDNYHQTLDEIFSMPSSATSRAKDRRKSTSSAKVSLQRLIGK